MTCKIPGIVRWTWRHFVPAKRKVLLSNADSCGITAIARPSQSGWAVKYSGYTLILESDGSVKGVHSVNSWRPFSGWTGEEMDCNKTTMVPNLPYCE